MIMGKLLGNDCIALTIVTVTVRVKKEKTVITEE